MEGKVARPVALFFVGLDADHDLRTSQAELTAAIKPEWARMDKDHSGSATAFEVAEWGEAVMGAADSLPNRVSFDTDMSGLVTFEEFAAGLQREFDKLDANHDGFLDRKELVGEAPQQRMDRGGEEGGQGGGRGPGGGGGGGGRGRRGGGGGY
jgi:Ca2+-binding EF-hand superfamily protein